MRVLRRLALLAVAATVVACGSSQAALERLAEAAELTAEAGSARVGVQQVLGASGPASRR